MKKRGRKKAFTSHFAGKIARRILQMALTLLGLSVLIFVIARVLPGDPVLAALGPRSTEWARQRLRDQLHLGEPLYLQYFYWLRDALSGNLGESLVTHRNVATDIAEFLPATLELVAFAAIADAVVAIVLGVLAGRHANTWVDNAVRGFSYIGASVPSFVIAIVLMLVFGYYWPILPISGRLSSGVTAPPTVTGLMTLDSLISGRIDVFLDALAHLFMPGIALALGAIAQEARITRSSIVENLRKDYVLSAVSHGLPERTIVLKYLLKPSLIPTVTIMALDIASLVGLSFLVETIFSWPGFSRYGTFAILRKDLNAIVGVVIVTGLIFAIANIVVDILVGYLDPRIRMAQKTE